jgi:HlyD family secretion protein
MASKKTRILLVILAAFVLLAVVGGAVARNQRDKVAVQTSKIARRDLTSIVSASGEVKPKRYVDISANVSGPIVLLAVKEGDRVKEGQVLAKIDSTRFAAGARQSDEAVSVARADLARARADVAVTRVAFERTEKLHGEGVISDQQLDQASADFKMKEAAVESAERHISQLEAASLSTRDDLVKTTVYSPMDGVVTSLPKEEGEVVIGAQSFSPTVIMTVADLSVMECEVMVDETDIQRLALGQAAEVRVDALERTKIEGTVTEIGSSAVVRGTSQTAGQTSASGNTGNQAKDFKVTITLKNPPPALRPGLNATADITVATRTNAVAVPIQAVVVRQVDRQGKVVDPDAVGKAPGSEEGGNTVLNVKARTEERDGVFVVDAAGAHFRPVKTGIMGDTDVEVLEGLKEGEEIVSGSYKTLRTLKDGARIKVEDPKKKSWWSQPPGH